MNYQFARIDDMTQVQIGNLQKYDYFVFCLKTRLNWSKNVTNERNAPWQAIVGCLDTTFYVLLSTSLWLEDHFQSYTNAQLSPYLFGVSADNTIPNGGQKSKIWYRGCTGCSSSIDRTYFHLKKVDLNPIVSRSTHPPM